MAQSDDYYPDDGPWAIAARASFLLVIVAVVFASVAPAWLVPHVLRSRHLQHFAAFYIVTLFAAAAMPRMEILRLGGTFGLFAAVLEVVRFLPRHHLEWAIADWQADFGGMLAAMAPMLAEQFRRRFGARPPIEDPEDS